VAVAPPAARDWARRQWLFTDANLVHCPAAEQKVKVGIVGGSDLHKIAEQLGEGRESKGTRRHPACPCCSRPRTYPCQPDAPLCHR
jgi:hypothetical protein